MLTTPCQGADRLEERLKGDVLQQIALRPFVERGQDLLVVVEGREDEDGRAVFSPSEIPEGADSVEDGHPQVEEHDVRTRCGDDVQRRPAVRGLADDVNILGESQQTPDALTHERLVVDEYATRIMAPQTVSLATRCSAAP